MDHRIHKTNSHPFSLNRANAIQKNKISPAISFKDQLNQLTKSEGLVLSKHAQKRLQERNISLDKQLWSKIEEKVQEAKKKGVNDSLVITNKAALLVSAKNNTVITAMDRTEASSQIFTNINGTILIEE